MVKKLTDSLSELKKIQALSAIAMLLALRVVLGMFANATLPFFGNMVKLSPAFLAVVVAGSIFGPVPAALVGALGDILSFMLVPTGGTYFPGFTISGVLTGLIYGFVFYGERLSLPRIAIGWAINTLAVETFLAALWLHIMYEQPYLFYLSTRWFSQAIKCIPEILVMLALAWPITALSNRLSGKANKKKA